MIHDRFVLKQYLRHFPLPKKWWSADIVSGPPHICAIEQIRAQVAKRIGLGPGIPTDVFILGTGEPSKRHVTKICGLPYRPVDEPWPTYKGEPLRFLGQLCFEDSKDITGKLPGDVLLMFSHPHDCEPLKVVFEWYPLGLKSLIAAGDVPEDFNCPYWGSIYRTVAYELPNDLDAFEEEFRTQFGFELGHSYHLFRLQATQIGPAPMFIQKSPNLPGRILGSLSAVRVAYDSPHPWTNQTKQIRSGPLALRGGEPGLAAR
jgi:hypothetical protein